MLHELSKQAIASLRKRAKKIKSIKAWHEETGIPYEMVSKMLNGNYPYPDSRKVDSKLLTAINYDEI